ncbi:MSP domain protein, partial [Teladorsagia circumcincta]
MSLTIDPPAASIPASGGKSAHTLANGGEAKVIFKVKCSNNNDYRLKPVFGFVDPSGNAPLEITRTVDLWFVHDLPWTSIVLKGKDRRKGVDGFQTLGDVQGSVLRNGRS